MSKYSIILLIFGTLFASSYIPSEDFISISDLYDETFQHAEDTKYADSTFTQEDIQDTINYLLDHYPEYDLTERIADTNTKCNPNEEISICAENLEIIADTIDYTVNANKEWKDLFTVNGQLVSETLFILSQRLRQNMEDCPCVGECSHCFEQIEN